MNDFDQQIAQSTGSPLQSSRIQALQVNIGLTCNQECRHCHVASSPRRTEQMDRATMAQVLVAARAVACELVDITGGAPELNPHFRSFITDLRRQGHRVQVRTNLTVLLEPEMETMPAFFRAQQVELVASLPCYSEENVDRQRGDGVYAKSVKTLQGLNELGYGRDPQLVLNLVYNPGGAALPPDQVALEDDYRRELMERHGIVFTHLLTITNMPIGRQGSDLKRSGEAGQYAQRLREAFNPATVEGLMCRHQINVGWNGTLYDCDFNLALRMPMDHGAPNHISAFDPAVVRNRRIVTGDHCFGCTAGSGSSCSGALL